jgi:hypothetical protein
VGSVEDDLESAKVAGLAEELAGLRTLTAQLRAENARLLRLLELTPKQAAPPGPAQTGFFEAHPGPVDQRSVPEVKVDSFAALFAARTDVYATRWENVRAGKAGWLPAVRGGWLKGVRHEDRDYLPLSKNVLRAHLTGEVHVGLYPLLDGDLCWWLAADFDGPMAMLDALAYLKAARAWSVPAPLEVSRSGMGAAETARRLGTALLREAMAVRGRMDLASYDRLFPSQDVLPSGGVGNLIAAPLQGKARHGGATVFLDLATMEPPRGPMGVPVLARTDEPCRGHSGRAPRRRRHRRCQDRQDQRCSLDPDPCHRTAHRACPAQLRNPSGIGRADPGVARDAEARCVDDKPGVL